MSQNCEKKLFHLFFSKLFYDYDFYACVFLFSTCPIWNKSIHRTSVYIFYIRLLCLMIRYGMVMISSSKKKFSKSIYFFAICPSSWERRRRWTKGLKYYMKEHAMPVTRLKLSTWLKYTFLSGKHVDKKTFLSVHFLAWKFS